MYHEQPPGGYLPPPPGTFAQAAPAHFGGPPPTGFVGVPPQRTGRSIGNKIAHGVAVTVLSLGLAFATLLTVGYAIHVATTERTVYEKAEHLGFGLAAGQGR